MISFSYGATFYLDEALKPLDDLYNCQDAEPKWYYNARMNIVHRLFKELEDDLNNVDDSVSRVCIDHSNWIECQFETDDSSILQVEIEQVQRKIQAVINAAIARYPEKIKAFHADLEHDGEEIPVALLK